MKSLLVSAADVKQFTAIESNMDDNKILPYIEKAQDIHIQDLLGTDLYEKLLSDISADTLAGDYATLVDTWIKPALCEWTFYEFLPYAGVQVSNKGVFRHTSEAATTVEDISELRNASKNNADYYSIRLVAYLCDKDFPEYSTNDGSDLGPSGGGKHSSWF